MMEHDEGTIKNDTCSINNAEQDDTPATTQTMMAEILNSWWFNSGSLVLSSISTINLR